jgi:hypothetical protein
MSVIEKAIAESRERNRFQPAEMGINPEDFHEPETIARKTIFMADLMDKAIAAEARFRDALEVAVRRIANTESAWKEKTLAEIERILEGK